MKRVGRYTILLETAPKIAGYASVVGKKEKEGPLGSEFDRSYKDTSLGESSWEKAESRLQKEAVEIALQKAGIHSNDVDTIFAGDLLNQCISSTFGLRSLNIPFLGQYGACSTMAQTLAMAALFVESGAARIAAAVTSSHFCSAERQFRLPLTTSSYSTMDRNCFRRCNCCTSIYRYRRKQCKNEKLQRKQFFGENTCYHRSMYWKNYRYGH